MTKKGHQFFLLRSAPPDENSGYVSDSANRQQLTCGTSHYRSSLYTHTHSRLFCALPWSAYLALVFFCRVFCDFLYFYFALFLKIVDRCQCNISVTFTKNLLHHIAASNTRLYKTDIPSVNCMTLYSTRSRCKYNQCKSWNVSCKQYSLVYDVFKVDCGGVDWQWTLNTLHS